MTATCGTANGYVQGCRCELCRAAKRDVQRAYRERKKNGTPFVRQPSVRIIPHGTRTGYVYGCRCDECREAQAAYSKRQGTTAAPTARRQPVRFVHDLVNLHHAMTLEEWRAREAADPDCRPVTQAPIHRRSPGDPDTDAAESITDIVVRGLIR